MTSGRARSATVLGAGVVSPAGSTLPDAWAVVGAGGHTRAEVMEYAELPELPVLGCRAAGFDPETFLERHELRRLDRTHQMSFWATDHALNAAGDGPDLARCAVVVGTGFGSELFQAAQLELFNKRGYRATSPLTIRS